MKRVLSSAVLVVTTLAGCATDPGSPRTEGLTSIAGAADEGERAFGVPADLTLAVAYTETRWTIPESEGAHAVEDEGHAPIPVGIGGLRPWLAGDPVARASRALGVSPERIAREAPIGILGTAAVLADLGHSRFGAELPSDVGAWAEVLGDYAGLDDAEARASYAEEVLGWLVRGVHTDAVGGELVTIAARAVLMPEGVAARASYIDPEYPGARWMAASSSNYSSGRSGERVRYIVIHTMQGSYSGSISWFRNPSAAASAHYMVRSSDGEITQMVAEGNMAWHAGNGTYNRRSIGIEHEGFIADPGRWYTDAMYRSSAALVRHLARKYSVPIDRTHIIGHNEVPDPYDPGAFGGAGNHTDPGRGWDWPRFMTLVRGEPARPARDASFVRMDHPAEMTSGERAVAWVELRNDGTSTWSIDGTRLGTTMPRDHASTFFDRENWLNDHRASGADHSDYGPGAVGRFTFMITAPEVAMDTRVTETFGLVQEGVGWFGPENVRLEVLVHPRTVAPQPTQNVTAAPIARVLPRDGIVNVAHAGGAMTTGCSVTAGGAGTPVVGLTLGALAMLVFVRRVSRRRR